MPKLFSQFILPSPSPIVSSLFSMSMSFKCRVKYSQLLRLCSSKPSTWHLTPSLSWVFSALACGSLDYFLFCAHSGIALLLLSRGTFPASWIRHMQVPISWWRQGGPSARLCVCVCACVFLPCLCSCLLSSTLPADLASCASLDSRFCPLTRGDRCVLKYSGQQWAGQTLGLTLFLPCLLEITCQFCFLFRV